MNTAHWLVHRGTIKDLTLQQENELVNLERLDTFLKATDAIKIKSLYRVTMDDLGKVDGGRGSLGRPSKTCNHN